MVNSTVLYTQKETAYFAVSFDSYTIFYGYST